LKNLLGIKISKFKYMADIKFKITPVKEKPKINRGIKGGIYNPIIEAFLEGGRDLVRVNGTGKDAYYLAEMLKKACRNLDVDGIKVSVRNKEVYLEAQ
jgi:hypothetical protein